MEKAGSVFAHRPAVFCGLTFWKSVYLVVVSLLDGLVGDSSFAAG